MASEEKAGFVYKSNTKVSKWDKRCVRIHERGAALRAAADGACRCSSGGW